MIQKNGWSLPVQEETLRWSRPKYQLSERTVCKLLDVERSSYRYGLDRIATRVCVRTC